MKKILSVFTAILMILTLTVPCFAEPVANVVAIIITSDYIENKDVFTFCAVGNLYGSGNNEPFTFSVERESLLLPDGNIAFESASDDSISEGMALYLTWGGEIMESYPMQLGRVHEAVLSDSAYEFAEGEYDEYYQMFYWVEDIDEDDTAHIEHIVVDIEDDSANGESSSNSGAVAPQEPGGEISPPYSPDDQSVSDENAADIGEVSGTTVSTKVGMSPWVFVSCIAIITVSIVLTVYAVIAIKANLKK